MTTLAVRDLTVEYNSGDYVVRPLDAFNLSAESGELVLLLGPSGCGKTTLLSVLAGILKPASGEVVVGGTDVASLTGDALTAYRRNSVGIVFQAFNLIGSLNAAANVAAPMRAAGVDRQTAEATAAELLRTVGLTERMHHLPGDLSGGQQQRVAIARALAMDPPLVVADEPTAHLDYIQVESVVRTLRRLAEPGRLVVVSTHDDRIVSVADRVVELSPGVATDADDVVEMTLAKGERLFAEGERGDYIYFIESGKIDIVRGGELLATLGKGEYFGELAPLLGFPRSAAAVAKTRAAVTGYTVTAFRREFGPAKLAQMVATGS